MINSTVPESQAVDSAEEEALRIFPSMRPTATAAPVAAPAAETPLPAAEPVRRASAPAEPPADGRPAPLPFADSPVDPEMKALREDPAIAMYGRTAANAALPETMFDSVVGQSIEVNGQVVEIDQEAARKGVAELRAMAGDMELSKDDIASVSDSLVFAQSIKGDEQKVAAARDSAVEMLNAEHGNQAALAVRAARAYVAKNPKLAAGLDETGAGDSPKTILLIARRALALHKAGKLTVPSGPSRSAQGTGGQRLYAASNMNP